MGYDYEKIFFDVVIPGFWDTIYMVSISTFLSVVIGFVIAVIFYVTDSVHGLSPNRIVNSVTNTIVNIIRSFPFLILMVALIPLTRVITGSSIGKTAALVPLTIAGACFFARLIETSFSMVDEKTVEMAKATGASNFQIITQVVLRESVPSLVQSITNGTIAILSTSAAAGSIGAGGLGAVAIMYGYQNYDSIIMYGTVFILVLMVQIIQMIGNKCYKKF